MGTAKYETIHKEDEYDIYCIDDDLVYINFKSGAKRFIGKISKPFNIFFKKEKSKNIFRKYDAIGFPKILIEKKGFIESICVQLESGSGHKHKSGYYVINRPDIDKHKKYHDPMDGFEPQIFIPIKAFTYCGSLTDICYSYDNKRNTLVLSKDA